jgi:glycosyltransferase involved in cell wall biosynthesis
LAEEEAGFTVVIPTYNSGARLSRCLDTICSQDYPREKVQLVVADGGSSDDTVEVARSYGAQVVNNPDRLAEYGVKAGMAFASKVLVIVFADDNGLVEGDWLSTVEAVFTANPDMSAFWCRLAAAHEDPPINHYFARIQSEPLSFFVNRYLSGYLKDSQTRRIAARRYQAFEARPDRPLVWGANGLVFRTAVIKPIWDVPGYLGDNDAFQVMLEQGHRAVGYSSDLHVYHHHVESLAQWRSKWKRNFSRHFLSKRDTRNLNWLYVPRFKLKLALWTLYSLVPLFSGLDALRLAVRDRDWHWIYHPPASFLQAETYLEILLLSAEGRRYLAALFNRRDG